MKGYARSLFKEVVDKSKKNYEELEELEESFKK